MPITGKQLLKCLRSNNLEYDFLYEISVAAGIEVSEELKQKKLQVFLLDDYVKKHGEKQCQ
ncbi:hypothetical protein HC141_03105 [Lactobacillus mulieris]|uniref:hypothetical protein n=1 Tax=Lactobacillus mulieris TaxID=2508708 RepID=UPI001432C6C1|nr:hypothetical protein [Lactobacillus mulieris]MDK6563809.1 hypothetical protein [Lactobacillus mulieris]MDK8082851.1 hypothetical protein [Lactobacillus mulieris]NKC42930.1 hypothetical protein [Lactobacillus mulieris]